MKKLAVLAVPALLVFACDASNPVAPVTPETAGASGTSAPVTGTALCKAAEPGGNFFSEASASRNNFLLRALVSLDAGGKEALSAASASDTALITVSYERPEGAAGGSASATLSTTLGFFEDQSGRRVQQCSLDLQPAAGGAAMRAFQPGRRLDANDAVATVALKPGDEIGDAQILAQLGELSAVPRSVRIIEPPPPLTADFMAEPNGLIVIFTDISMGEPNRWSWDFGDNTCDLDGNQPADPITCEAPEEFPECCQQNPVHEYTERGEFVVALRVKRDTFPDNDSVANKFVSVGADLELVADFAFDAGSGGGLTVLFTDTSQGNPSTWAWDFGDGGSSSEQNPIHTYSVPDEYPVTLKVTAAGGLESSKSKLVNVGSGIAPLQAKFSFTVAEGSLTVQFVNESTGGPTGFAWTFGDDASFSLPASPQSTQENPVHTYGFSGEYIVTLQVTDEGGNTDLASRVIRVDSGEKRPVARFSFEKLGGLTVKFTDESDNEPTAWSWSFDDGSCPGGSECSEPNPTHQFKDGARQYKVELTVSNGADEDSTFTTVDLRNLQADFSFRQNGCTGVFTDRSTGTTSATQWSWDFGDGGTSTDQSPTHDYERNGVCPFGDYRVTLTITDAGLSDTVVKTITIAPF